MNDVEILAEIAKQVYPDAKVEIVNGWKSGGEPLAYCIVDGELFDPTETENGKSTKRAKASSLDVMIAFYLTAYRYTNGLYGARHCMGSLDEDMNAPTVGAAIYEAAKGMIEQGARHGSMG